MNSDPIGRSTGGFLLFLIPVLLPLICFGQETLKVTLIEQEPAASSTVTNTLPAIRARFGDDIKNLLVKEKLLIEVDRSDVSALTQFADGVLFYQAQVPLSAGSHDVRITGTTSDDRKIEDIQWSFVVADPNAPRAWQFGIEPVGTFEYKVREDTLTPLDRSRFNSNIAITSQTTRPFQAMFTSNLQAQGPAAGPIPPPGPSEFDLANFNLTLTGSSSTFSLGDVNINYDPLSVASLSRRGFFFEQKLPFYNSGFSIFSVRSETIFGFRHGLGFSDRDQRVDGGSLFFAPTNRPEVLNFRLYYLRGENELEQGFNFGGVTRGSKGNVFGLNVNGSVWANQLRFEAYTGWSDFDFNASDEFEGNNDQAFLTRLIFDPMQTTWNNRPSKFMVQLEVQRLGTFFKSLGNPFFLSDRRGFNLTSNWTYGIVGVNAGIAKFRDNIEELNLVPVVDNAAFSTGFTVFPVSPTGFSNWPSVSVTATRAHQESRGDVVGFLAVDNIADSVSATFQLARANWNGALTTAFGLNNDRNNRVPDTDIKSIALSAIFMPYPFWTMGPSIAWIRQGNRDTGVDTDQWTYSWTSSIPVQPERFHIDSQLSYSSSESSDFQNITSNFGGTIQLNYHFHHLWRSRGKQSVFARLAYNRNIAEAPFISRVKGFEIFTGIDLGWPFR